MQPRSSHPLLLAAVLALPCVAWTSSAHAGRPLTVDDANVDTVGDGHIEVWWEGLRGQRGSLYAAPAYTPMEGLELGVVLARDLHERQTLQGLQVKWLFTAALTQGCNTAATAGATRRSPGPAQNGGSTVALNLIGTCAMEWGVANANAGMQREPTLPWRATWGLSVEHSLGAVTPHLEAFGTQHNPPVVQAGARWEWTQGYQLDATLGRQQRRTLLSLGFARGF